MFLLYATVVMLGTDHGHHHDHDHHDHDHGHGHHHGHRHSHEDYWSEWPRIQDHISSPPPDTVDYTLSPEEEDEIYWDFMSPFYWEYMEGSVSEQLEKWTTQTMFVHLEVRETSPDDTYDFHCGKCYDMLGFRCLHFFGDSGYVLVDTSEKLPKDYRGIHAPLDETRRHELFQGDGMSGLITYKWCSDEYLWYTEFFRWDSYAYYDTDRTTVRKYWSCVDGQWILEE